MTSVNLPIYWKAWAKRHNSHGPVLSDMIWLPDGDVPDGDVPDGCGDWVQIPGLIFVQSSEFEEK